MARPSHVKALPDPNPTSSDYRLLKSLVLAVSVLQGTLRKDLELDRAVTFRDLQDGALLGSSTTAIPTITESTNFSHSPRQGWQLNNLSVSYIYHRLDVGSIDTYGTIKSKGYDAILFNGFEIPTAAAASFWHGLIVGARLDVRGALMLVEYADSAAVSAAYTALGLTITDGDVVNIAGDLMVRRSGSWVSFSTPFVHNPDNYSASFLLMGA